ncbi:hypothetical protein Tco_0957883 [Tanacetum coccineum]
MIDCLSIVKTDKVIHTMETDIVKLVVEIESFGMSSDEFDKETGSSDGLQPKQADLSCVHALNELHLHEIRIVPRIYGVSVPALTKDHKGISPIRRIQRDSIRRIQDIVLEYSRRYQVWSLLKEIPDTPYPTLGYAVSNRLPDLINRKLKNEFSVC